ncbi:MAG: AAA family ATPase [Lachnospiraceae bacterium]|nr:AAA family ATPase [Lachnospiraceae bacterium]
MTEKTEKLILELTGALFEKKAILLMGNSGVGKTFLAKEIAKLLKEKQYSVYPASDVQDVEVEVLSCHNSVTYEDVVGGISTNTGHGNMSFEYKDKILIETLYKAADAFENGLGKKYVLIFDDIQRSEMSCLLGDAIQAIGLEGEKHKFYLNSGVMVDVTPNFYVIATYNSTETGSVNICNELLGRFYAREILSDAAYITEESDSENAAMYNRVRSTILTYLDIQYKTSSYEQNRYLLGHGYFYGNNLTLKMKHQLIPILKQYIAEGILDKSAETAIKLLEDMCNEKMKNTGVEEEENCFCGYSHNVSSHRFLTEEATSVPLENIIGRIIDQRLLSNSDVKSRLLFNTQVCFREKEVYGVTYQAQLLANGTQYDKIRRGGSDGRKLYNGGTLEVDGIEYHFTGGMQPREYTVRNPKRKMEIWNILDGYEIGESTSPNVILFRITWQYYMTLISNYETYLLSNPNDVGKRKLLEYIKHEWEDFLSAFKKIKPIADSDANRKAENNKNANFEVRKLISELSVLWSDLGTRLRMKDGTEVVLEGVEKDMNESIYKEYSEAMDTLGIRQMILQGPPGTSKTYSAKEFLKYMAHNCSDTELEEVLIADYSKADRYCTKLVMGKGEPEIAWDIVQFHPSYGYEDFIRGIKVSTKVGSDTIVYETVNKVLGNIAELAKKHKETKFYLIIDEINRANLATVFGELIYGLEYRAEAVATPYAVNDNNRISLPENLYIIGTMNTADKSIGGIDYAIRRRFLFFEQLPDENVIKEYKASEGETQRALNEQAIRLFSHVGKIFGTDYLSPEYRREDVQIGHTYFLVDSKEKLLRRFEYQIIPILKEYYKDGIISFVSDDGESGFSGFLNCISGKINISAQKELVERIFEELIM